MNATTTTTRMTLLLAITTLASGSAIRGNNNNKLPLRKSNDDDDDDNDAVRHLMTPPVDDNTDCSLSLDLSCTVRRIANDGSILGYQDCSNFVLPTSNLEPCTQTPLTTTFLYNGGDCSQSDNTEALGFICRDGLMDSPPTAEDDQSFVVVTNTDDEEQLDTYYQDWVTVGSNFQVGNGELMDEGFWIRIYDAEDRLNLLQEVVYEPSLCSDNLEMLNRFGASQIVGYTNEDQGEVAPFASYSLEVELLLDISMHGEDGESATMQSLGLLTNFANFLDLNEDVVDKSVGTDKSLSVTLPIDVDVTAKKQYTILSQLSASRDGGNGMCEGTEFLKFSIGA